MILEPLSYFFGAMLGDGYLYRYGIGESRRTGIDCSDWDIVDRCYRDVTNYFTDLKPGRRRTYVTYTGTLMHQVKWSDRELYNLMLIAFGDYKLHIPYYIWNSSRKSKLQFLAGLMDTDGSISKRKDENSYCLRFGGKYPFVKEVPMLLNDLGIKIASMYNHSQDSDILMLNLSVQSSIENGFQFYCDRKHQVYLKAFSRYLSP